MISEAEARAWIEAYGQAWISQDPQQVVQLYTRDAGYREHRFRPAIHGSQCIWDYWDRIVRELQRDIGFEVKSVAVSGDTAYINWTSHFTWNPINGVMELDAMARIEFSNEAANGLRLASNFEEWIDRREA